MNNSDNSGVNTIILVVILGFIIFGLVWFFGGGVVEPKQDGVNVELNIPAGENTGATQE